MRYILAILLCLFACIRPAFGADAIMSPAPEFLLTDEDDGGGGLRLAAEAGYVGQADFTNGLGSVSVLRTTLAADYSIFRLSYGLSRFIWEDKGQVRFARGDKAPWENLHDVTLQARMFDNSLGGGWRYWLNGELSSSFETDFPGAVGAGLDGGVAYEFLDGWMLGFTGKTIILSALRDDLLGDLEVGVALAVSQKAVRRALKSLGLARMMGDGSERIGFSLAFSGADKTYRLAPDSPVRRNGYLGLVRSKVGAYLSYRHDEHLTFTIGPEYNYARKYKLYDSSGALSSSHRLDDAFGGSCRLLWAF
jgi:hypothetical protein